MQGKLYIVATPIGNLGDITVRALETLKSVDVVLAEDTRVTKKLLSHYDIDNHIVSYHQQSSDNKKLEILNMLNQGKNLALVTDAGTPGISDPGNELIQFIQTSSSEFSRDFVARNSSPEDLNVVAVPGASALTAAISVSGMNFSKFTFIGFMPKKKKLKLIKSLGEGDLPFVFYESPHRIIKTLKVLEEVLEDRHVFIARELTKMHETHYRGSLSTVLEQIENESHLKGELVVLVDKKSKSSGANQS